MKNLMGEHIATADVVVDTLLAQKLSCAKVSHVDDTKQGFTLTKGTGLLEEKQKGFHGKPGLYVIYKGHPEHFGVPMYVGESEVSVGTRLSRFVKEAMNKSRLDENHSAAKKWRTFFGSDLDDCYVRVFDEEIQSTVTHKEIESELKRRLNPLLNVR